MPGHVTFAEVEVMPSLDTTSCSIRNELFCIPCKMRNVLIFLLPGRTTLNKVVLFESHNSSRYKLGICKQLSLVQCEIRNV